MTRSHIFSNFNLLYTHKTKHETPRIHNNKNKKHKHRIQTIHNRTQPKKNIQRNKHKKQLKIRKNYQKKLETQKTTKNFASHPQKIKKRKKVNLFFSN